MEYNDHWIRLELSRAWQLTIFSRNGVPSWSRPNIHYMLFVIGFRHIIDDYKYGYAELSRNESHLAFLFIANHVHGF